VFELQKTPGVLKQASRAWYQQLNTFVLENGFGRGQIDKTLFIKTNREDFIIKQVCVEDKLFRATNNYLCKEFSNLMSREFEMSMVEESMFFVGLLIKQLKGGIFVNQGKYVSELLKKYKMNAEHASSPMASNAKLDQDPNGKPVNKKFIEV